MKTLGEEETSHTHRVRAPANVNRWFAAMTSEQRGELLTGLMAHHSPVKVPAMSGGGASTPASAPAHAEGLERLALGNLPADLSLTRYQRVIVDAVGEGAALTRSLGSPWVLSKRAGMGVSVREDTIRNLLDLGALREE